MRATRAVLLCAGRGTRMGALGTERPKCLLEVAGRTILDRQIDALAAARVSDVTIVVGHAAEAIREHLEGRAGRGPEGRGPKIVENPLYATTNVLASLACALRGRPDPDALVVLAGDVVFEPPILADLLRGKDGIRIAVDPARKDAEAVKVRRDGERLAAIGKELPVAEADGEFLGILAATGDAAHQVARTAVGMIDAGARDAYLYGMLQRFLAAGAPSIHCVPVGRRPWEEVDTPRDLDRARTRFAAPGGRTP